ncbi:MAG: hypothetical protein HQK51_13505, partial [Oligoflexia bacterium]|nr:hypothetical protein [Oligoflexia bacterium]
MQFYSMKFATVFLVLSLVLTGGATSLPSVAGVTTINDSRLEDINNTPNIGRGYSPSTNTYQSYCMDEVVLTKPTMDFEYTFEDVSSASSSSTSSSTSVEANAKYKFLSVSIKADSTTQSGTTEKRQMLLATIKAKKYYSAMNEAKSKLSGMAAELLKGKDKDLVSFFNACGPYYIKSLTRSS